MKQETVILMILIISFICLFIAFNINLFSRQGSILDLTHRSYSQKNYDQNDNVYYTPSDKRRRFELKTF